MLNINSSNNMDIEYPFGDTFIFAVTEDDIIDATRRLRFQVSPNGNPKTTVLEKVFYPENNAFIISLTDDDTKKLEINNTYEYRLTYFSTNDERTTTLNGTIYVQWGAPNVDNAHTPSMPTIHVGNLTVEKRLNAHRAAEVLDHPDGSVTSEKLAEKSILTKHISAEALRKIDTNKFDGDISVYVGDDVDPNSIDNREYPFGTTVYKLIDDFDLAAYSGILIVHGECKDDFLTLEKLYQTKIELVNGSISHRHSLSVEGNRATAWSDWESKYATQNDVAEVKENIESREKSANKGVPGGYAPLNAAGKIPNEFLDGKIIKEYGVRWKGTSSTVCERLGDAVGLVANAQLGVVSTVQNDFDNIYPWSEMRLCNLDAEGNILAYADEPSFTRDGTNGDVMVQIPKFYYKREKTAEGYEEWWICAVKLPGYELHPVFMDDGKEVSAVFHSAYNASNEKLEDGTTILRSISGVQPAVRSTRASFRTKARNKGTGWCIEDIACVNALQMLYMVEYASTHSQEKLGDGASSLNYTEDHCAVEAGKNTNEFVTSTASTNKYSVGERIEIGTYRSNANKTSTPRTITAITAREDDADISVITFDGEPIAEIAVGDMMWNTAPLNGSCDELNGGSGYIGKNGKADCAYRGIEGFHGKLFRFIDGVNIKDRAVFYANSTADYADGVYDGKYRAVGYTSGTASGYISEFGYDEKAPWVMFPTEAKGNSTTYVPDYYYSYTGEHLLTVGGRFALGVGAGVFCFACGGSYTYGSLHSGAHLIIKKP